MPGRKIPGTSKRPLRSWEKNIITNTTSKCSRRTEASRGGHDPAQVKRRWKKRVGFGMAPAYRRAGKPSLPFLSPAPSATGRQRCSQRLSTSRVHDHPTRPDGQRPAAASTGGTTCTARSLEGCFASWIGPLKHQAYAYHSM